MIFLAMDSSIIKQDLSFTAFYYQVLKTLVDEEKIRIVLPEIVIDECRTELSSKMEKLCVAMEKNCSEAFKFLSKTEHIRESINAIEALKFEVVSLKTVSATFMQRFLQEYQIQTIRYSKKATELAWQLYFKGEGPVKEIKNRNDIPDSFIYSAIYQNIDKYEPLHFICADNKLRDAIGSLDNIITHSRIDDFFEHDNIKPLLRSIENTYDTPIRKFGRVNRTSINAIISSKLPIILNGDRFSDSTKKNANIYRIEDVMTIDNCDFTCWGSASSNTSEITFHGNAIVLAKMTKYYFDAALNKHIKDKEILERIIIDGTIRAIISDGQISLEKLANAEYQEDYWSTIQIY